MPEDLDVDEVVRFLNIVLGQRNQLEWEVFRLRRQVAALTPQPDGTMVPPVGTHG